MEITTEKTHTLIMSDSELNTIRCFIGEALDDGYWLSAPDDFPEDRTIVEQFYQKVLNACLGRYT